VCASHAVVSHGGVQLVDGITFLYVKRNGLFFVLTTKFNVSPSLSIELLDRCTKVFKVIVDPGAVCAGWGCLWRCLLWWSLVSLCDRSPTPPVVSHLISSESDTPPCHHPYARSLGPWAWTQDYCGVLTEESIRKNFILVYELLDEMIVRVATTAELLPPPPLLPLR
jgi:hypothetical protein